MNQFLIILLSTLTFHVQGVTFRMQPVQGGTMTLGGTPEQMSDRVSLDKPTHQVSLPTYYIGETEVTKLLWQRVMGRGDEQLIESLADDCPVVMVSWYDCQEFIRRLDSITGMDFRLPTEAEWEYAARGGEQSRGTRFAGSDQPDSVAWLFLNSGNRVHGVARKAPNELGIYDMTGNVWEWCADTFAYYTADPILQPILGFSPDTATGRRIMRGACMSNAVDNSHLSKRRMEDPSYLFLDCGLRLALSAQPKIDSLAPHIRVKCGLHSFHFCLVQTDSLHTPYYIAERDVLRREWQSVMHDRSRRRQPGYEAIDDLSRSECTAFLVQLHRLTGYYFRLPTLEEWNRQARLERQILEESSARSTVHRHQGSGHQRRNRQRANMFLELLHLHAPVPEDATLEVLSTDTLDYTSHHLMDVSYNKENTNSNNNTKRTLRLILCP